MKIAVAAGFATFTGSCLGPDYVMYEDGEFDGASFMEEYNMHNAEVDMDDLYRDWSPRVDCHHECFSLKNINKVIILVP